MSTREMIFRIKSPNIKVDLIPYYLTVESALIEAGFDCTFADYFGTGFEVNIKNKKYMVAPDHVDVGYYRIVTAKPDLYVPDNNSALDEIITTLTRIKEGVIVYPTFSK